MTHSQIVDIVRIATRFRTEYGTNGASEFGDFAEFAIDSNGFNADAFDEHEDQIGDIFDAVFA